MRQITPEFMQLILWHKYHEGKPWGEGGIGVLQQTFDGWTDKLRDGSPSVQGREIAIKRVLKVIGTPDVADIEIDDILPANWRNELKQRLTELDRFDRYAFLFAEAGGPATIAGNGRAFLIGVVAVLLALASIGGVWCVLQLRTRLELANNVSIPLTMLPETEQDTSEKRNKLPRVKSVEGLIISGGAAQATNFLQEVGWIFYHPSGFNPGVKGQLASVDTVKTELRKLHENTQFRGLITSGVDRGQSEIAKVARDEGFTHIIATVYFDPASDVETVAADALRASEYADAYMIHYAGTDKDAASLGKLIRMLQRTGHLVGLRFRQYEPHDELVLLLDFVAVDVDWNSLDYNSVEAAITALDEKLDLIEEEWAGETPRFVGMFRYPSKGSHFTDIDQREFFSKAIVVGRRRANGNTFLWYYLAFDKEYEGSSEGIFSANGDPKKAVEAFRQFRP